MHQQVAAGGIARLEAWPGVGQRAGEPFHVYLRAWDWYDNVVHMVNVVEDALPVAVVESNG